MGYDGKIKSGSGDSGLLGESCAIFLLERPPARRDILTTLGFQELTVANSKLLVPQEGNAWTSSDAMLEIASYWIVQAN